MRDRPTTATQIILEGMAGHRTALTRVECVIRANCPECGTELTFDVNPNDAVFDGRDMWAVGLLEEHIEFFDAECRGCTRTWKIVPYPGGKYRLRQAGVAETAHDLDHLIYTYAGRIYRDVENPERILHDFVNDLGRMRAQQATYAAKKRVY